MGNYDIPDNWPRPPVKNPPGDVPGPPVQYGPAVNPDDVAPGYGFSQPLPLREDDIYFYHSDHLGSTSYVTDADANPTQFVCYMPFGEAFVDEHTTRLEMPYKFNGKEQDAETGLYYYGARYYDAVEGRFLGIDQMTDKHPDYTPYAYVYNNPIKFIDPFGLDTLAINNLTQEKWHNFDVNADVIQLNEVTVIAQKQNSQNSRVKAASKESETNGLLYWSSTAGSVWGFYDSFGYNHTSYPTTKGLMKNFSDFTGRKMSRQALKYTGRSKFVKGGSNFGTGLMVFQSAYNYYNGDRSVINYMDGGIGLIGLGNAALLQYSSYGSAALGPFVAVYGAARLTYDFVAVPNINHIQNNIINNNYPLEGVYNPTTGMYDRTFGW